ncbi:MAG TPA: HAMP domain-containing sensor histidine kinase [Longimicrobiales bacterium]|nr:HAMP domain-containing sensor histidine kinase [Longimicrobiales bacterium]
MRLALLGRVRSALFLKILLVFIAALTAMGAYFMVTFWLFDWERERASVQMTAANYARFILRELDDPPDTAQARALSERLGVGMRIEGPGVDWASTATFADFGTVELPLVGGEGAVRAGIDRETLGFGALLERGDYRYLMALQAGRIALGTGSSTEDLADALFMVAILAGVYVLMRRLLRPVRVLSEGVERLRTGDLEVEMPTRRTDELGRLIVSFNEMARAVRERIRARDQLLLDVSHELRSPLTRMRVALEMLPDSRAKQSVVEDVAEVEAMITELLETERLDSPHGGLARTRADLSELVRDAVAAMDEEGPGVHLVGAEAPRHAEVDVERLRMVINNVLSNALKYSDPRGGPVRVVLDSADGAVLVSFHDRGVGIAAHDLAYVFEPFYRADRSRTKETGGYGIGLSLAKRIVEAHGGSIEVSSELGEGTSVLVTLPAAGNGGPMGRPRW